MTPTILPQPVRLPLRWPGHGDIETVIDGEFIWVAADDVERLAGLPAWGEGETVLADGWPEVRDGRAYYAAEVATAKARDHGGRLGAEFADWLAEVLPELTRPETAEELRRPVPLSDAVTVARAARDLEMKRAALFDLLVSEGWVEHTRDGFRVLPAATAARWATIRLVPRPGPGGGKHARYHQPYITPAGMDELRRIVADRDDSLLAGVA